MTERRIVSIWLPNYPIERWTRRRRRSGEALDDCWSIALVKDGPNGPVIHAATKTARASGARLNARVTDARTLNPTLIVYAADLSGDARDLNKLAMWCRRWCPWSACDGADGVVLDTTGSSHLWGGELTLLKEIETAFAALGHRVRVAAAPTHGAAWALARHANRRDDQHGNQQRVICSRNEIAQALAPLPTAALRLEPTTVLLLRRLGLKRIGALAELPRKSLAKRFGASADRSLQTPLLRLDQALGRRPEPILSPDPPKRFRAQIRLTDPVLDPEPHIPTLANALCADLAAERQGARRLRFEAFRCDGEVGFIETATARPTRDAAHIARLFSGRFDEFDPGFGFDAIMLDAAQVEPLTECQIRLDHTEDDHASLARLIDRLRARLGEKAVRYADRLNSHWPERAERWGMSPPVGGVAGLRQQDRPLKLLAPPEPVYIVYAVPEGPPAQFVWRRQTHRVKRHQGPERIAPEWWREKSTARLRDYYRIEDSEGRRYWLFREGLLSDGRGDDPDWFMHGVFP